VTAGGGRTVLVTGAGGGMARGINARLAAAGHGVVCTDVEAAAAERAAEDVRAQGGRAWAFPLDVTHDAAVSELRAAVEAAAGPVDAVVNAAGVLDRKRLGDHTGDSFLTALDVNLAGPFRVIREFTPGMVERGWGRVVNISSIAGVTGYPYPSYAASKGGLSNLTRSLVVDLWGTGVTVNAICPGSVDTPMVIDVVRRQVEKKVPTGRMIDPEEIGALAAFLLTDEARNINGANLVVDGGATATFEFFSER